MSTDTDYIITIKGKNAALRKAAADFIELSLNPWNPQREDKKTLTRLDVFRNESNCAEFFAPSSLCEEAAKLFPGANVSFSSKDEYGYTQEGEWIEEGQAPGNVETAVAEKVFERIRAEVEHPSRQVKWLIPLVEWISDNKPAKKIADLVRQTLAEAQVAEREVKAQLEAEAERESLIEREATETFDSMTRWRLDGASIRKFLQEQGLKRPLAQEIGACIALNDSHVFFAAGNFSAKDEPSGRIVCAALLDGRIEWASEKAFSSCSELVLSDDSTALAVCADVGKPPFLVCLDAASGKEHWRAPLDDCCSSFRIAAYSETAALLSYDDNNKAWVSWWRIETGHKIGETTSQEAIWFRPELALDSVQTYVAARSWVKSFDIEGHEIWHVQLPECNMVNLALTADNKLVVSRGDQGAVCLHCETGTAAWAVPPDELWTPSSLVGDNHTAFFAAAGMCSVRDTRDGSQLRQIKISEEHMAATPIAIADQRILLKTGYSLFEWFGVAKGERLGAFGFSPARSIRANGVLAKQGTLLCIGSPKMGDPIQVVCVDLGIGSPSGAWPMARQGPGGASFLHIQEKEGYKQFISAWKDGEDLSHRLAKFAPAPDGDKARVARIHGIIRGHELIAQARSWVEPSIGSAKTATARGGQWRLVMAYGGFELLAKSLTATKGGGLEEKTLSDLIGKLSLPDFDALVPPSIEKSSLKKWMEEEDASYVLDFLKMENGDRKRFDAWLSKQKPIETWTDAVLLAKALRSATVHGALSPTKIEEWKISDAVSRLTDAIFRLDEAMFEVLGKT